MNKITNWGGRLSNFELLRLLCMLMVLNLHSFFGYTHGDGVLQAFDFLRESTSICAVDTFILISGYFGIKWKKKGIFNLMFQVLFYSFVVYGVCVVTGILQFDKQGFLQCFKCFYDGWGFITCYLVLYFVSPWLNAFSEKTDKRELLSFIIIFFIAENFIFREAGALNFCLVYLIGRLLSKYDLNKLSKYAGWGYVFATMVIFLCVFTSYKLMHYNSVEMNNFVLGYSYSSPFVIMQAVFLFLIFSRIQITNKAINWCAASCLSIFLIHMHPAIKEIGYLRFTENLYDKPLWQHVASLFVLFVAVFFGAILIDKVRIIISNITYKSLSNLAKPLKPRLEKILSDHHSNN